MLCFAPAAWAAAKDDPPDKAAEEGRRVVARHADALDGEAKRMRPKNDRAAEMVARAAEALRELIEQSAGPAAEPGPTPFDPEAGAAGPGGAAPPARARGRGARPVKTAIVSAAEFRKSYAASYPREANLARGGRATASSTHSSMDEPVTALGGLRKRDSWAQNGGKGWFLAEWPEPISGRYVIVFNRPADAPDAWDSAAFEINGRPVASIGTFTRGQVLVIDLGETVAIKTLKVTIEGQENPGVSGIEIHRDTSPKRK